MMEIPTFITLAEKSNIEKRKGAHLPHWTSDSGAYHVVFRLIDSIPAEIQKHLIEEKNLICEKLRKPGELLSIQDKKLLHRLYFEKIDHYLLAGYGSCWLQNEKIAVIVANAMKYFDGDRYHLFAWCVMSNHVHAIVQPVGKHKLSEILYSWKSYTSKEANKILGRSGQFWQTEYFDRLIRDPDEFEYSVDYVLNNPKQAGLDNWKWVGP
jgi:REP element-mobilizing transposase RayT